MENQNIPGVKVIPSLARKEISKEELEAGRVAGYHSGIIKLAGVHLPMQSTVSALVAELRKEPDLGLNRVAIPTHALEELGFEYKRISREHMATLAAYVDVTSDLGKLESGESTLLYTPGFIEVDQVVGDSAFGFFIPLRLVEQVEIFKRALNTFLYVQARIDFIDVSFDHKSVCISSSEKTDELVHVVIVTTNSKGQEVSNRVPLKTARDYLPTPKEAFDALTDKKKAEHISWLRHLDPSLRADRRIMRDFLESDILIEQYNEDNPEGISHQEYLAELIDANIEDLAKFKDMDSLDDEAYIEAVKTLIQTEAELEWGLAKKDPASVPEDMTFEEWIIEQYGRPFIEIHHTFLSQEFPDRFKALDGVEEDEEIEEDFEANVKTIAVGLDGTIFEEPLGDVLVGGESPYAIEILKKLKQNGHRVILLAENRSKEDLDDIISMLKERGLEFTAVNRQIANEKNNGINLANTTLGNLSVDFIIDKRCLWASTNSIYNPKAQTLMWSPVASRLVDLGLLYEEDMTDIAASLEITYAEHHKRAAAMQSQEMA